MVRRGSQTDDRRTVSIVEPAPMVPMVGDPDDHRPNTSWSLIVDPGDSNGRVDSLAIIREAIAAGDRIPLHTHDVDEAITIIDGEAEARLGDDRRRVGPGTTIFIPAGTPHGAANIGAAAVQIHAASPPPPSRSRCSSATRRPARRATLPVGAGTTWARRVRGHRLRNLSASDRRQVALPLTAR